jgi:hypothetical protein
VAKRDGFENHRDFSLREFESHPHRMAEKIMIVGSAIVFKKASRGERWFIVKEDEDSDWELPKAASRRVESSARTAIRIMQEKGGAKIKILAEAGRAGGSTVVNSKTVPMRCLYYLAKYWDEAGEEGIGFHQLLWLDYAGAVRKLASKRDRQMLKAAREELRRLKKTEEGKELLKIKRD